MVYSMFEFCRSIVETLLQEIERSPRQDSEDKKKQVNVCNSFSVNSDNIYLLVLLNTT